MALYLAEGIETGRLDYLAVFKIARYTALKPTVDAILIADGFQNLIVPIV
jgi:hypothetical protein